MKVISTILIVCFFITTHFCQEILSDPGHEIFSGSENYNYQLTYNLEPVGTIWDVVWPNPTTHLFSIDTDGSSNGGLFYSEPNLPVQYWKGYNYIASWWNVPTKDFGFGFYKLSVMNKYIYLDWRDTRYGDYYSPCNGHCADIWIKYDGQDANIYLKSDVNGIWGDPVTNGSIFSIWDLKSQGVPLTSGVPSYWQNCLVLIRSQTGNHPYLVWGPYPDFNSASYRLYRRITTSSGQLTNFISTTETSYIDNQFTIGTRNGQDFVEYWVKALNAQNQESDETNHVDTHGISEIQWKINQEIQNCTIDFKLNQNCPNPFNPTTKISYSIKEDGLVMLKVYNILGKEVATLVNENKPGGLYEAVFDASSLPSGMYIYKLQAGNFTEVKKMILTK